MFIACRLCYQESIIRSVRFSVRCESQKQSHAYPSISIFKMSFWRLIFLLTAVKAREARHNTIDKTTEDDIKQFESERPHIELKKGLNMGNHTSAKSLQSYVAEKIGSGYVGVAVNIQNYSPFLLTDVQKNVLWGYTVFSTFQFCNHFHKGSQGSRVPN